jgi:flagellar biosynthetic protein FliR
VSALAPELLLGGLLASVRVTALVATAPVFGHLAVPVRIRAGLAVAIAMALAPALPVPAIAATTDAFGIVAAVTGEIAMGAALGFASRLVFDAVGLLGGVFSAQGGLGAASVVDPASGAPSTAPSMLFEAIAVLVWFSIDGHHALLRAAAFSFDLTAPGGGLAVPSLLGVARLGGDLFATATRLAAPILVAMGIANVGLGVLGRALPEMNLMMVQIPAHVLFGFGVLLAGATPFGEALGKTLAAWSVRAATAVLGGS